MEIIKFSLNETNTFKEPISACIGYFDGLHKGHQTLVKKAQEEAKNRNIKSAIITFFPDPKDVITGQKHKHIQAFEHRLRIFEAFDIDICIIFDFTKEMCALSKDEFFEKVLRKLNLECLVCGFDFHYAYKGSGDHLTLKDSSEGLFDVLVIDSVNYLDKKISSTLVRRAIEYGNIQLTNLLLGYTYHLIGKVVKGKQIGQSIGFPTANLLVDAETILPEKGVYIGYAKHDGNTYKAMINIGNNPTVADNNQVTIEIHICNFDKSIYGDELIVYFKSKIRDEVKFDDLEDLSRQLSLDIKAAERQKDEPRLLL